MKKFLILVAAMFFSVTTFAQSTEKAVKQYGFWDNWFIQFQGGASENFAENYSKASFTDVLSPAAAIGVGKYFSPEVGARIQLNGWEAKTYVPAKDDTYGIKNFGVNFDALFNLSNIFCPYKENRVFNLIGIVGIGAVRGFAKHDNLVNIGNTRSISPRVGLAADFRLSDAWNFNVEANGNLDNDGFNGIIGGRKYEGRLNALVGFTYKFKNIGFKLLDAVDPSVISSLNSQINAQRQQIDSLENALKNQPVAQPAAPVAAAPQKDILNSVVLFKIGQSVIEENQKASLYNVANYIKNNNTKVTVVGYADKNTGSAKRNQKISELRAASVAKALESLGVDSSKITTDAKGDTVQPFSDNNDWNRVVILTQE